MISFHETQFPADVSWGSSGGPVYKTQIFAAQNGHEKRNIDWSQPMMAFNVAYGIRTENQIARVVDFFNARQGRLSGFRYKNWSNYEVSYGPIATGDGYSQRLPLWKMYGFHGTQHYKRLYKIVRGSVRGVHIRSEPIVEGVDFNIDYNAGEIILNTTLGYGVPIMVQHLEFDEPVRFDTDSLEASIDAFNNNSFATLNLIGVRGTYSPGSVFSPDLKAIGHTDPHFGRVALLLNFDDGQEDALTTQDSSLMASPVQLSGGAHIDLTNYHHGNGSLSLGPAGRVIVAGAAQDISSVPFTLELFAQRPSEGEVIQPLFSRWDASAGQRSYTLRYNLTTQRLELAVSAYGDAERVLFSYPWDSLPTEFTYIRVDRTTSGWWNLRIDGRIVQSARDFDLVHGGTAPCTVGCYSTHASGEGPYRGAIDSIRLTAGICRDSSFEKIEVPVPYGRLAATGFAQNRGQLILPQLVT